MGGEGSGEGVPYMFLWGGGGLGGAGVYIRCNAP